jgi:hypothetical protein
MKPRGKKSGYPFSCPWCARSMVTKKPGPQRSEETEYRIYAIAMALKAARQKKKLDGYFMRLWKLPAKFFPNAKDAAKSFDNFKRKYRSDIEKEARF